MYGLPTRIERHSRGEPTMFEVITFNQEEEKIIIMENTKPFKLITGGKEPPSESSCWLEKMPVGSIFFVQEKNPLAFALGCFKLVDIEGIVNKAYILIELNTPAQPIPVVPNRFCNKYMLYENLGIHNEKKVLDKEEIPVHND
jgi:hypothetical protein